MSAFHPIIAVLPTWPIPEASWEGRSALPAGDGTGRVAVQILVTDDEEIALAGIAEAVYKSDAAGLFNAKARFKEIAWDALGFMWGYEP